MTTTEPAPSPPTVDLELLRKQLRVLATCPRGPTPVLSCYVSFEPETPWRAVLQRRARELRAGLGTRDRESFDLAMALIWSELERRDPDCRGMAMFARAEPELLRSLAFHTPVPTLLVLDELPSIYPLMELKDRYDQFVVAITTERSVRILEVSLGAVTREVWEHAPPVDAELRQRWGRVHYQNHRRDRADRFLREKLQLLDRVMSAHKHSYLILAGEPRLVARMRDALPKHLRAKLIDLLPGAVHDVVPAALARFIEHEQHESFDAAEALCREIRRQGLGTVGTQATIEALQRGQADLLVMTSAYAPGRGWACSRCELIQDGPPELPGACTSCGAVLGGVDLRERIVQLAERTGCGFERVEAHPELDALGGVGCLLRYAGS